MTVFVGNEYVISPIGESAQENFEMICSRKTGISKFKNKGYQGANYYASLFADKNQPIHFLDLLQKCIEGLNIPEELIQSEKTKIIISSTKGNINTSLERNFDVVFDEFHKINQFSKKPVIISNACISGVMAVNKAADLIKLKKYDHVIVIGCDLISAFVLYGFESLFAMSNSPCKPFDKQRKGINLGEGAAAVLVSKNKDLFSEPPVEYISGATSNDANHISGPSRNGEGLYRCVQKTLEAGNITVEQLDFISAHGTATVFNDNMESIAFKRLNLLGVKLNSLKGYFGHTLGAAGLIEIAMSIQMIRNNRIVASLGFSETGTDETLNVVVKTHPSKVDCILKTASGFGGGNAALILKVI